MRERRRIGLVEYRGAVADNKGRLFETLHAIDMATGLAAFNIMGRWQIGQCTWMRVG